MAYTYTTTFTLSHAKHLASKVVADLYQRSFLYDQPSADSVQAYEAELTTLLAGRYVETYEFGFKLNEQRVLIPARVRVGAWRRLWGAEASPTVRAV